MIRIEKVAIISALITLILILSLTLRSYSQRYQDGSIAFQASTYPFYNLKKEYRANKFTAINVGYVNYKQNYTRWTGELFYSEKKVTTNLYKTHIKEYIVSYGYGFPLVSVLQNFFNIYADFGGLLGFTEVKNEEIHENIKSPFKQGLTFGLYGQLNAEISLLDFLVVFARAQLSYNGFLVFESWPFYQGIGVRIVFN